MKSELKIGIELLKNQYTIERGKYTCAAGKIFIDFVALFYHFFVLFLIFCILLTNQKNIPDISVTYPDNQSISGDHPENDKTAEITYSSGQLCPNERFGMSK